MAVSYLLIAGMIVCSVILAQSVSADSDANGAGVGLTALGLFGAAAAIGAMVGFLFGLPRARFVDNPQAEHPADQTGSVADAERSRRAHYLTNSNLTKVSDWLTTIIIGLGLVNIAKVGSAAGDLRGALEEPLGGAAYSGVIGVSVIVIALLASTILCYLWTSIIVRELLEDSARR